MTLESCIRACLAGGVVSEPVVEAACESILSQAVFALTLAVCPPTVCVGKKTQLASGSAFFDARTRPAGWNNVHALREQKDHYTPVGAIGVITLSLVRISIELGLLRLGEK